MVFFLVGGGRVWNESPVSDIVTVRLQSAFVKFSDTGKPSGQRCFPGHQTTLPINRSKIMLCHSLVKKLSPLARCSGVEGIKRAVYKQIFQGGTVNFTSHLCIVYYFPRTACPCCVSYRTDIA